MFKFYKIYIKIKLVNKIYNLNKKIIKKDIKINYKSSILSNRCF